MLYKEIIVELQFIELKPDLVGTVPALVLNLCNHYGCATLRHAHVNREPNEEKLRCKTHAREKKTTPAYVLRNILA